MMNKTNNIDFAALSKNTVFSAQQIAERLPHAFPFVLVDKIVEMGERHIIGMKNVTMNEWFFQGHFPNNPVMPGVLMVEGMAQTGGILSPGRTIVLNFTLSNFKNTSTFVILS